jgi:hypothetical protein
MKSLIMIRSGSELYLEPRGIHERRNGIKTRYCDSLPACRSSEGPQFTRSALNTRRFLAFEMRLDLAGYRTFF